MSGLDFDWVKVRSTLTIAMIYAMKEGFWKPIEIKKIVKMKGYAANF